MQSGYDVQRVSIAKNDGETDNEKARKNDIHSKPIRLTKKPLNQNVSASHTSNSSTEPPLQAFPTQPRPKTAVHKNGRFVTATRTFQRAGLGGRAVFLIHTAMSHAKERVPVVFCFLRKALPSSTPLAARLEEG